MSRENVDVVRRTNRPLDGEDLVPLIRKLVDSVDWSDRDAVVNAFAEVFPVRHIHPDIEWAATGAVGDVWRGPYGVARFWAEWVGDWESYIYHVEKYRDLGSWVLTVGERSRQLGAAEFPWRCRRSRSGR